LLNLLKPRVDNVAEPLELTVILVQRDESVIGRRRVFSSRPLPSGAALGYLAALIAGA